MGSRPHILVAGAGLAGLAAARDLEARGARVTVVEARDRVGGRTWTLRDGFARHQYAEAGADFIDSTQRAILDLAKALKLSLVPIVKRGFGYYGVDPQGRLRRQSMASSWRHMPAAFYQLVRDYRVSEHRWDGPVAARLGSQSVADWLKETQAPAWLAHRLRGFRGLFLADPEELALLALVDFFADVDDDGWGEMYRLREGADRLATRLAEQLAEPVESRAILRKVHAESSGSIRATIERLRGRAELVVDGLVVAMPASTVRDVEFDPPLPDVQREAVTRLKYGAASRLVVQFDRRFWKRPGQPNAFGSDQPYGAFWEGNEEQTGPEGILCFLAGGRASAELQALLKAEGLDGLTRRLRWLGRPAKVVASRLIVWEEDPWARGGYAYFDPAFHPAWRDLLARPHGRVVFAGEHTSLRWQGYMNGAVESGQRAAAEILTLVTAARPTRPAATPRPKTR